jgi:alkylhydroperoxidase family enzyme
VGWNHQADYEWVHHVAIARSIGMSDADILAVQQAPAPSHLDALESLLLCAADEVKAQGEISGETWARLKEHYSDQQMLDLIFTLGQYTLVCIAIKSIRVPLEEGLTGLPG